MESDICTTIMIVTTLPEFYCFGLYIAEPQAFRNVCELLPDLVVHIVLYRVLPVLDIFFHMVIGLHDRIPRILHSKTELSHGSV